MGDPCLLEEDLSAPYPECCPRMQCPTFDDVPDELNEIDDDQLMMADEQNPMVVSYDATLDHVCTVAKIYTPIFSFFGKKVVKIAICQLRSVSNENPGNLRF